MMTTTLAMPSVTHAMKGQRLLRGAGYRCEIEKSKQPDGCVYALVVSGSAAAPLLELLRRNGLPVMQIAEG